MMTGLWDREALAAPPVVRILECDAGIESVLFAAEPYHGRRTEVFAYVGRPPGPGPFPGMVCLHAGGGGADREWVELWAARGYAAIAPDLAARGPGGQLMDRGGPEPIPAAELAPGVPPRESWSYHAAAAALRARSLLASYPSVDAERLGIVGVSWGGALACVAAGLEPRFAAAVSVFGTGFLESESGRERSRLFDGLSPAERRRWHELFDPASHLPRYRGPLLLASGATDGGFPLDLLKKTAALPPGPVYLAVRPEMDHGHGSALRCQEVYRFADHALRGAPPPPRVGEIERSEDRLVAPVTSEAPLASAALHLTRDRGEWKRRRWESLPARLAQSHVESSLSAGTTACFFTVEDREGYLASSPHQELGPAV
jgi:dienelactone hydrolase